MEAVRPIPLGQEELAQLDRDLLAEPALLQETAAAAAAQAPPGVPV
jgi:hypothetical protein